MNKIQIWIAKPVHNSLQHENRPKQNKVTQINIIKFKFFSFCSSPEAIKITFSTRSHSVNLRWQHWFHHHRVHHLHHARTKVTVGVFQINKCQADSSGFLSLSRNVISCKRFRTLIWPHSRKRVVLRITLNNVSRFLNF